MACKAFRGLIAERQLEIVAMRSDQTHSTLDFPLPHLHQLMKKRGLEDFDVVRFGHAACIGELRGQGITETAPISDCSRTRFGCNRRIGLRHERK